MTEQKIRERIRALEDEIYELKALLPKKERKAKIKQSHYTTCKHCGSDRAEVAIATVICDKCNLMYSLFEDVTLK
jgi:hypothetical protein